MLETLKFVRAAVCKHGHNPAMMHFRIVGGTVQANNGRLAIQAPFPSDLDCCPVADSFVKAVAACEDVVSMHVDAGRLVIRSGKFKSSVPVCDADRFPDYRPEGAMFPIGQPILPILRKLLPFVSTDERRPWACGVNFVNNSAIATNSICIVEHWLPVAFPVIANLPREAIVELIRVKVEPISLQFSSHAVTFHLPGGAWISSKVLKYEWPDVQKVFAQAAKAGKNYMDSAALDLLLADVEKLEGFTDDAKAVHFHKGSVSTTPEGTPGTSIDSPFSPGKGVFRADQLKSLRGIVDRIGFDVYPSPVPFFGGNQLRGVMVGFQPLS